MRVRFEWSGEVVDLSAPLDGASPVWPGERGPRATVTASLDRDGYFTRSLELAEHTGTHLDAPAHFVPSTADPASLPPERLVVPAVLMDIADRARRDPDAVLTVDDVDAHERAHGPVPEGCAVLVRTGWDAHMADPERFVVARRFPGVSVAAARLLVRRGVAGLGIDSPGVDPGWAVDFPVHQGVTLPAGVWHLECLVGLARLPARGALLVVGVLPVVGGSGAPARVFALLPAG